MDPFANLASQISLANQIVNLTEHGATVPDELADALACRVLELDEWRRNGGFDPYTNKED